MVKCNSCKKKLGETFLKKPLGTVVYEKSGGKRKKRWYCSDCQRAGKTNAGQGTNDT